ncbi:beta-lactamase [Aureobasidium pullulans]|nr:beta-lactamase [Aureobasidium pullulans]
MDTESLIKLERLITKNARLSSHASVTSVLQDLGTPTVSLAILDGEKILPHCFTAGSDDTSTLFQACSISKPVASVLTFKLIEAGKLSLHASIAEYLPISAIEALETTATKGMAKFITISQLLSHTSGLETSGSQGFPGYDVSKNANGHYRAALPDLAEALEGQWPSNTLPIRLKDWPGHVFNYSGGGMGVLQLIIEAVMDAPFAELMDEHVFKPLGMKRSMYVIPEEDGLNDSTKEGKQGCGNYARAYYNGYTSCEAPHRVNPEQSAAGLWTTPSDLLTLVSAIQTSLHADTGFLPKRLAASMLTEVQSGMAHAWFITPDHFGHGGSNMPGWKCNLLASLTNKRALAVMTNSAEGAKVFWKVQAALFYLLGWEKASNFWYERNCVVPFADVFAVTPYETILAPWSGGWKEQDREWIVELVFESCVPWLKVGQMPKQRLWIAAHAKGEYQDGAKIVVDLVCKGGVEVLIRLVEDKEGKPMMEMWNGNTGSVVMMEKV